MIILDFWLYKYRGAGCSPALAVEYCNTLKHYINKPEALRELLHKETAHIDKNKGKKGLSMKASIFDFWLFRFKKRGLCDDLAHLLAYGIEYKSELYALHKPEALPAYLREENRKLEAKRDYLISFKSWQAAKKDNDKT